MLKPNTHILETDLNNAIGFGHALYIPHILIKISKQCLIYYNIPYTIGINNQYSLHYTDTKYYYIIDYMYITLCH